MLADALPNFNFPTTWLKKHCFSFFPIMIKIQLTLQLKKLLEYEFIEASSREAKIDMWIYEFIILIPAFWVALDLYRHSVSSKNPCMVARVFAWVYCTIIPTFIVWYSIELLKQWGTPDYETRKRTE